MNKIGIIGAMELEVELLINAMNVDEVINKATLSFHTGTIGGTPIVVVQSGIGKVNAALCTQILVDLFEVTHVINTGVAGSLNNALDIGDIVISKDAIHHDLDVTVFGYALGQVPSFNFVEFTADSELINLANASCGKHITDCNVMLGRIISGDQFITTSKHKKSLIKNFQATCTEMEGASIAHVCHVNDIPFVIIRSISDKADNSAHIDYPEFEAFAAKRSSALVIQMVTDFPTE